MRGTLLDYQNLVDEAIAWAHKKPFSMLAIGRFLRDAGVPRSESKRGHGDPDVDRVFWLGEVLDEIKAVARDELGRAGAVELQDYIDQVRDQPAKHLYVSLADEPSPLGGRLHIVNPARPPQPNPPRGIRPQRVVAMLEKDQKIITPGRVMGQPEDIANALADYLAPRATESFVALYLDARNRLIGYSEMSSNLQAAVEVGVDGVLRDCLLKGGIGIVTAHNHPSGDASPSDADFALWRRLTTACEIVNLINLDNLVVTRTHFYSEKQGDTVRYRPDAESSS